MLKNKLSFIFFLLFNFLFANNGYLSNNSQSKVDIGLFCEGHNQRGLNVSWYNDHSEPYGILESNMNFKQSLIKNEYLASNKFSDYGSSNSEIKINIEIDSLEYLIGQPFTYYITISNLTEETINIPNNKINFTYTGLSNNYEYTSARSDNTTYYYEIKPYSKIIIPNTVVFRFLDTSVDVKMRKKLLNFWESGQYSIKVNIENISGEVYNSNELLLNIKSVPQNVKHLFNRLTEIDTYSHYHLDDYDRIFETYKSEYDKQAFRATPYELSFLLFCIRDYYRNIDKEKNFKEEVAKEIIFNYPNTNTAYSLIKKAYDNKDNNFKKFIEIIETIPEKKKKHLIEVLKINNVINN
ncbi:MAG: hypothetical protein JXR46_08405 [Calditrichaceae bacterium]|nr:hypothetical protein [Calditrichaceae bacterium]MBN2709052.1 hypothetical protein [Calditrichaceae bacterium]RQV97010.1 MAG: hypothetical protein EH224_02630 [Calditrichota bacterium]